MHIQIRTKDLQTRRDAMTVAYVLSTTGHAADYKPGRMILPQLEEGRHGAALPSALPNSEPLP